jgi:hypothetical protein
MQPLSEDKWTSTLDKEVPSSSLSTKLEEDFDTELAWAYGDIFSKSIEKLKDASTVRLCLTTLSWFLDVRQQHQSKKFERKIYLSNLYSCLVLACWCFHLGVDNRENKPISHFFYWHFYYLHCRVTILKLSGNGGLSRMHGEALSC